MKQARLDQLADGIFAIVMTILVFEIRIPNFSGMVSDQLLFQAILDAAPVFISYLLSFSLLFTYWRSHHFIASILAKNIDTRFSNLNAIFFFFVGLVPFWSYILGKYNYSKTAIIFFALNIIFIGLSLFRMRQYVIQSETIENKSFTKTENAHANMHILFPVGAAVLAIIISFFSSEAAILLLTLAILFNFLEKSTKYTFALLNFFQRRK
ncbi:MAG: TMEM175 family protein [Patescibacteria group bacterium]